MPSLSCGSPRELALKKDGEIKLLLDERGKGVRQKLAAARAGVSERTARKYEQAGKLPSQMKANDVARIDTVVLVGMHQERGRSVSFAC